MNARIVSAALREPPRPQYSGKIPITLVEIEIDPTTDPEECRWGLTYLLRSALPLPSEEIVFFRCAVNIPQSLRVAIAAVIGLVVPGSTIGSYRPPFEGQAGDFYLHTRTRENLPWDYSVPECWLQA